MAAAGGLHAPPLGLRGRVRAGPALGTLAGRTGRRREEHALLQRVEETLGRRLAAFGKEPHRYGLVHTDLRAANLIVDGGTTTVIDFDDSGFSWYLYDFGGAVAFIEDDPRLDAMAEAWVRGYRRVLDLSSDEVAELPTFVLYRRDDAARLARVAPAHGHGGGVRQRLRRRHLRVAERYLASHG